MMSKMTLWLIGERLELDCSKDGVGWSGAIGIVETGSGRKTTMTMIATTMTRGLIEVFRSVG